MSKYEPLARFLTQHGADSITLAFDRIDEILGSDLPPSAHDHRTWWANRHDGRDAQNLGWQSVGWEVKDIDMKRKFVTFSRIVKIRADVIKSPDVRTLTIEEAKKGLAAHFQVDPTAISITISA